MSNKSIWLKERDLSASTFPDQSGPGSDGNEEIHRISYSYIITEAWQSHCLVSYKNTY